MAGRRRARRSSPAEMTSDEESMSSAESSVSESEGQTATTRKRSRRIAQQGSTPETPQSQRVPRAKGRAHAEVSYKEDTTDNDEFDEAEDEAPASPTPKRRRVMPRRHQQSARPQRNGGSRPAPGPRTRAPVKILAKAVSTWRYTRSDTMLERKPPFFEMLPFEIWVQIFEYASYPLFDPLVLRNSENRQWLAGACRICKSLLGPAITALYEAPPLATLYAPHELYDSLMVPLKNRATSKFGHPINLNVKIRRLELDANVLAYTAHGRGRFDLASLVPLAPRLQTLRISSIFDLPANRHMHRQANWNYPDSLFASLNEHNIRLKSFEWHQGLFSKHQDIAWMQAVHLTEAFQTTTKLKLSGFDTTDVTKKTYATSLQGEGQSADEKLAEAISALPNLKSLDFEACTALTERLSSLLPGRLECLRITDCTHFDSQMLGTLLAAGGGQLKELVLKHNKALDIRFLPGLKESCPRLEVLQMDLNYYKSSYTYLDSNPKYEDLFTADEIPTWPDTLRILEFLHLRNWTETAARTFFKSLVDSAERLPDLRVLRVKAIISLGWRERKAFREEWVSKLERVFLRRSAEPNPHFQTLASGRAWLIHQRAGTGAVGERSRNAATGTYSSLPTPPADAAPGKADSQRSLRPRRGDAHYSDPSDSEGTPPLSSPRLQSVDKPVNGSSLASAVRQLLEVHVQSMCDIVDITMDNLRPAETQFRERDFVGSEPSDDEEWDPTAGDRGDLYDGWTN